MVLLNHPSSRTRGHSLNIQKACHLPQTVIALTFGSVYQKAPLGSAQPVCGTAASTPQKKTADSPAPPTCTEHKTYFKTMHRNRNSNPSEQSLLVQPFECPHHYASIGHNNNFTQTDRKHLFMAGMKTVNTKQTGLTRSHYCKSL